MKVGPSTLEGPSWADKAVKVSNTDSLYSYYSPVIWCIAFFVLKGAKLGGESLYKLKSGCHPLLSSVIDRLPYLWNIQELGWSNWAECSHYQEEMGRLSKVWLVPHCEDAIMEHLKATVTLMGPWEWQIHKHHHNCYQIREIPHACSWNNIMVLHEDGPGWIFPYVSTFGSWGKRDCQLCRNHGFHYKYCWRPYFRWANNS